MHDGHSGDAFRHRHSAVGYFRPTTCSLSHAGLSSEPVDARRQQYGPNEVLEKNPHAILAGTVLTVVGIPGVDAGAVAPNRLRADRCRDVLARHQRRRQGSVVQEQAPLPKHGGVGRAARAVPGSRHQDARPGARPHTSTTPAPPCDFDVGLEVRSSVASWSRLQSSCDRRPS
jgi:Cation transporter/ATPase, N-terminus